MGDDEAHEAMRALAGAVCPECGVGFDEVKRFTDPDEFEVDSFSVGMGGLSPRGTTKLMITVHPCGCRLTAYQYADLKRRLKR